MANEGGETRWLEFCATAAVRAIANAGAGPFIRPLTHRDVGEAIVRTTHMCVEARMSGGMPAGEYDHVEGAAGALANWVRKARPVGFVRFETITARLQATVQDNEAGVVVRATRHYRMETNARVILLEVLCLGCEDQGREVTVLVDPEPLNVGGDRMIAEVKP